MFRSTRIAVAVLLVLLILPALALAGNVVFLVRTGTDAEGNPMFRMADSRDTYLSSLFELTQSSKALYETTRYYDAVQKEKVAAALQQQGVTGAQLQYAQANFQTEPVFIEVTNSRSGSYNDWKGRFSVIYPNGQAYSFSSPRVVYALGGDVARSGNRSLIEQTLVHEVAHGVMAKAEGRNNLPDTPWLSKPHSGGSVSDDKLAFIEGWAEFIGAYFTGRQTIAGDPAGAIQTNWYGRGKNAQQLINTEGWNATVFYHIATQGASQNAMWKMTQVMARTQPQNTWQLLTNLVRYYPELAPTVNQVVYADSGGQIAGPGGQTGYASNYGTSGGASGNAGAPIKKNKTWVIVAPAGNRNVGYVVDSVTPIIRVNTSAVLPAPEIAL
ncbi:MAG: hypothetical protein HY815_30310, partial [Candidatus Riflebacteria bacterium]|nr:hypothetical protein [Candidatus Riflebacteria bacterium]